MQILWRFLREWAGEDAYERHLLRHAGHNHPMPTRREFYRSYYDQQGRRPRCC